VNALNFTEEIWKHFFKRMLHLIQKVFVFGTCAITIRSVEHNDNYALYFSLFVRRS